MTTNAELDILKGLGLPPYEAKVFLALIDIEQGTSADIHKASGVPRTSIHIFGPYVLHSRTNPFCTRTLQML